MLMVMSKWWYVEGRVEVVVKVVSRWWYVEGHVEVVVC